MRSKYLRRLAMNFFFEKIPRLRNTICTVASFSKHTLNISYEHYQVPAADQIKHLSPDQNCGIFFFTAKDWSGG